MFINAVLINHGTPRHSISNTLDPTMLDIAISPLPAKKHAVKMCIPILSFINKLHKKNTGYLFCLFWKIVLEQKS